MLLKNSIRTEVATCFMTGYLLTFHFKISKKKKALKLLSFKAFCWWR